jgi:hypothetical protein
MHHRGLIAVHRYWNNVTVRVLSRPKIASMANVLSKWWHGKPNSGRHFRVITDPRCVDRHQNDASQTAEMTKCERRNF